MKLIETIQINRSIAQNIGYHNRRLNLARKELFDYTKGIDLQRYLHVPQVLADDLVRCRVTYQKDIEKIEYLPYMHKSIKRLKLVDAPSISYAFKWENRQIFADLLQQHPDADEVIVIQQGKITDCTIANLAFWDGKQWFTPSTPLLKGTKRAQLLKQKKLQEKSIGVEDIHQYQKVCLINAFRNLDFENAVDCKSILQ